MQRAFTIAILLAGTTSVFAQSLTEKIEVSLVNVDVTVTSHGAPAKGLGRDDFEIREDGVLQSITHFYAIENALEKTATAEGNTPSASPMPANTIVVAVHDQVTDSVGVAKQRIEF